MAPPGGDMFYIGLYKAKMKKIFYSETTRPRADKHSILSNLAIISFILSSLANTLSFLV